jgi:NAD(P)-dependent dehydrogenase (short-subunit alcohol dehydrogenase family)
MSSSAKRVAVVTGAARNLGAEVARQLAAEGFDVVVTARRAEQAKAVADEIAAGGGNARAHELVVSDQSSVDRFVSAVREDPCRVDVLVNNAAGYVEWSELPSTADLDASRQLFETNLWGTWRVTQALLPLLRESPSARIVNVASGAGSHGDMDFGLTTSGGASPSYGISKAAINALTSKLGAELEDSPILVNSVCPGLTATAPGMEAMGARPIPDGARSIVWAALIPDDGPSGGFFRDGKPLPW